MLIINAATFNNMIRLLENRIKKWTYKLIASFPAIYKIRKNKIGVYATI